MVIFKCYFSGEHIALSINKKQQRCEHTFVVWRIVPNDVALTVPWWFAFINFTVVWKLNEKEVDYTITWKKLSQSNTCQRRSGLCNLCIEERVEILLSKAKPSTQLNRRFEVSTCRHVSPYTSIAPTSKLIKAEPTFAPVCRSSLSSAYVKHSVTTCGSKCNINYLYM